MITLDDVLDGTQGRLASPIEQDVSFRRVITDSRLARDGDLFVALRGQRDGHYFVADACRRGAAGAIVERQEHGSFAAIGDKARAFVLAVVPDSLSALQALAHYWLVKHRVRVIAVTGSVGKTTTKELVAGVLGQRFKVLKNEKNFNNEIGLPLSLLQLRPDDERAVLEMGMYAVGEIAALCRIAPPQTGIVTNIGPTHLERLGSIERTAAAKGELIRALPEYGLAVLNGDDARVADMARLTAARSILYGFGAPCDLRVLAVESRALDGLSFRFRFRNAVFDAGIPLPGAHNVYNCLSAIAVGLEEGLTWPEIEAGLVAGARYSRIVEIPGRNGATIVDDTYNASPVSVLAALDLLGEVKGRRIAVLGDMFELGSYEAEGHRSVGERAARRVDMLVVVGPRARMIGEAALGAGLANVVFARSKEDVPMDFGPGDYVLFKGSRGMAMEELVAKLRAPQVDPSGVADEVTNE